MTSRWILKLSTTKKCDKFVGSGFSEGPAAVTIGEGGAADGSCTLREPEEGGVTTRGRVVLASSAEAVESPSDIRPIPLCDFLYSPDCRAVCLRLRTEPLLTISVIRSKYTSRLKKTSYVVGQYL